MNPRGENKSNVQKPTINIVPDVLPWTQGVSHAPAVPAWPRIEKKHENSSTQSQHQAPDFVNLVSYSVPYTDNLAPVSLKHQNTISIDEVHTTPKKRRSAIPVDESDSVQDILRKISNNLEDIDLQHDALAILRNTTVANDVKTQMMTHAGIETIISSMNKHCDDVQVQHDGCAVLINVMATSDQRRKVISNKGMEVMTQSMARHVDDSELQQLTLTAIRKLCANDIEDKIASCRVIDRIHEAMVVHGDDAQLMYRACSALGSVASLDSDICTSMATAGSVELISSAMATFSDDSQLMLCATGALHNLSSNSACMTRLAECNGIDRLMKAITMHINDSKVLLNTFPVLVKLSKNEANRAKIKICGGIDKILSIVDRHIDDVDVLQDAHATLRNVTSNSAASLAKEMSRVSSMETLKRLSSNSDFKEAALLARERLDVLDQRLRPIPPPGPYRQVLMDSIKSLALGDITYFTFKGMDSFHTAWLNECSKNLGFEVKSGQAVDEMLLIKPSDWLLSRPKNWAPAPRTIPVDNVAPVTSYAPYSSYQTEPNPLDYRGIRAHLLEQQKLRMDALDTKIDNLFAASFLGVSMDGKDLPRTPKPTGITTSLFTHQEQALAWMTSRENDAYTEIGPNNKTHFFWTWHSDGTFENMLTHQRTDNKNDVQFPGGGLLCDDMGLGKTLSFLSLCVAQRESESKRYPGRKIRTLVIAPTSVLQEWADQIEQHVDSDIVQYRVVIYHDMSQRNLENLLSADIVITSYGILSREFTNRKNKNSRHTPRTAMVNNIEVDDEGLYTSGLFHRMICDEGQKIKNHKSQASEAVRSLDTQMRWIATGTPLNNNLTELYAMYAAIRARPFDDEEVWGAIIRLPLKSHDMMIKEAGFKRLQTLVKVTCLRRVKSRPSAASSNQPGTVLLPELEMVKREIELPRSERLLYDQIELKSRQQVKAALQNNGSNIKGVVCVLALLMRMRQACCHPSLTLNKESITDDLADIQETLNDLIQADDDEQNRIPEDVIAKIKQVINDDVDCPLCLCPISRDNQIVTPCGHVFCHKCIMPALLRCPACPVCAQLVDVCTVRRVHDILTDRHDGDDQFVTSAKIKQLIDDIKYKMLDNQKILIFTQWTSYMDLISEQLRANDIGYVKLVGAMSRTQRSSAIKTFQGAPASECKAFLISLHAGGFGLNLTAASHVAMMDLWWNVAVEQQAIDRAWRLGNTSPKVTVWRYVTKRTVEERIIELQEAKDFVVHSAFGGDGYDHKSSAAKLSDIQNRMSWVKETALQVTWCNNNA